MKVFILILIHTILFSGSRDTAMKIEIYLLKTRLEQRDLEGVPESVARPFLATQYDLQDTPFIRDCDIIWYDTVKPKICLTKSASRKIHALDPPVNDGTQFVLTVDKEPVICGYFTSRHTSQPVLSYTISGYAEIDSIFRIGRFIPGDKTDDRINITLIKALNETGRLKK